jgi:hypothetical protein
VRRPRDRMGADEHFLIIVFSSFSFTIVSCQESELVKGSISKGHSVIDRQRLKGFVALPH